MVKRQLIMDKALELFAKQGFEATTVQQITDYCGISKGAFYLSFKSKDELILALIDHFMQQIIVSIDHLVRTTESEKLLHEFYREIFHSFQKHSDFAKVLIKEQAHTINSEFMLKMTYYDRLMDLSILSMLERLYGGAIAGTKYDLVYCVKGFMNTYSHLFLFMDDAPLDLDLLATSLMEKTNLLAKHTSIPFISQEMVEIFLHAANFGGAGENEDGGGFGGGAGNGGADAGIGKARASIGTDAGIGEARACIGTDAGIGEARACIGTDIGIGEARACIGTDAGIGETRARNDGNGGDGSLGGGAGTSGNSGDGNLGEGTGTSGNGGDGNLGEGTGTSGNGGAGNLGGSTGTGGKGGDEGTGTGGNGGAGSFARTRFGIGVCPNQQIIALIDQKLAEFGADDEILSESLKLLKRDVLEPTLSPAVIKGLIENIRKHPHCRWVAYLLEQKRR